MFRAATEWALEERLPVVYLAANSGARVGLASEVKQCLRVSVGQAGAGQGGAPPPGCSSSGRAGAGRAAAGTRNVCGPRPPRSCSGCPTHLCWHSLPPTPPPQPPVLA